MTARRPAPAPLSEEQRRVLATLTPAQRASLMPPRGRRTESEREFLGLPLYSLALGPDPLAGETRGHARGVVAIGDVATGVIAVGGWARGVIAVGGVATGLFSIGGLSLGLLGAVGGLALSVGIAMGGAAVGSVAVGGAAAGHYAAGGAPYGTFVAGPRRVDPELLAFFDRYGLAFTLPDVRTPARAR